MTQPAKLRFSPGSFQISKVILLFSAAALLTGTVARADVFVQQRREDIPVVKRIVPVALASGEETTVRIVGERLGGLNRVLCNPSVRLKEVIESSDKEAKLILQVDESVEPGAKSRLVLDVRRREGILGEVNVQPVNVPTGLKIPAIKVPEKQNRVEIDLVADAGLLPGRRTLRFEAQLQPKPMGKKKAEPLSAIAEVPVEIRPLVSLRSAPKKLK